MEAAYKIECTLDGDQSCDAEKHVLNNNVIRMKPFHVKLLSIKKNTSVYNRSSILYTFLSVLNRNDS